MFREFDGRLNSDVAVQVPIETGSNAFDAFAPESELFARLSALWNVNGSFALKGGYLNFSTQSGGGEPNGYCAVQIISIPFKDVVLFDPYFNVEVPSRAAIGSRLSIASASDSHA